MKYTYFGSNYSARSYKELVTLMNFDSLFGYSPKLKEYRKGFAKRYRMLTGKVIPTRSNRAFVKGLERAGIMRRCK